MEHIKKVALSVLAAMAAVCMAVALLLWSLPMLRAVAAETTASTAEELQQQIDSADVGDTVKLGADISADIEVPKGKEITLDLNGFTLTNESDHTIMNYGVLTIVDDSTPSWAERIRAASKTAQVRRKAAGTAGMSLKTSDI